MSHPWPLPPYRPQDYRYLRELLGDEEFRRVVLGTEQGERRDLPPIGYSEPASGAQGSIRRASLGTRTPLLGENWIPTEVLGTTEFEEPGHVIPLRKVARVVDVEQ